MFNNRVPKNWTKVGFLSLKPLNKWVEDFLQRVAFFRKWFDAALQEDPMPGYWLSAFFLPAGFLTAV